MVVFNHLVDINQRMANPFLLEIIRKTEYKSKSYFNVVQFVKIILDFFLRWHYILMLEDYYHE